MSSSAWLCSVIGSSERTAVVTPVMSSGAAGAAGDDVTCTEDVAATGRARSCAGATPALSDRIQDGVVRREVGLLEGSPLKMYPNSFRSTTFMRSFRLSWTSMRSRYGITMMRFSAASARSMP